MSDIGMSNTELARAIYAADLAIALANLGSDSATAEAHQAHLRELLSIQRARAATQPKEQQE